LVAPCRVAELSIRKDNRLHGNQGVEGVTRLCDTLKLQFDPRRVDDRTTKSEDVSRFLTEYHSVNSSAVIFKGTNFKCNSNSTVVMIKCWWSLIKLVYATEIMVYGSYIIL
jgi:hypothetical protein